MTPTAYKLAALFFVILGVTCSMGSVVLFKHNDPDRWLCLVVGFMGVFGAVVIRVGASLKR